MPNELAELTNYQTNSTDLLTPALLIYPGFVSQNIAAMLRSVGGDADRWRPHLKTAKVGRVIEMLVKAGVTSAKVATTLELETACGAGMQDILVAFAHSGANARRIGQLAREFPRVNISMLAESADQLEDWPDWLVGAFIDVNPGMDRTGAAADSVTELASFLQKRSIEFRGIHFYDGHATEADFEERTQKAHARYRGLLELIGQLERQGITVREVITAGTPAFPCALSFDGFRQAGFRHQVSPGTIVYNDASSLKQLPAQLGFVPAALVISRVISRPKPDVITCDAGHKSVSVDSGVPNCVALEHPELTPLKPSEEHLPMQVAPGAAIPPRGEVLYLLPRHVCPTVNNFDVALFVRGGVVESAETVSARGRERADILLSSEGEHDGTRRNEQPAYHFGGR